MADSYHYLFGPVASRRLGRSLGIDVTPFKTCSFNCVFCQCGCTTKLLSERGEFVPFEDVCLELDHWLKHDGKADCITFAGSGEPTLYSRLGDVINFLKSRTSIPVIVLSNGTLLHRIKVRDELLKADVVKVSLSAWDDASFKTINRPCPGLSFEQLLAGEREFRAEFSGKLWVEVFLLEGINAEEKQVRKIAAAAAAIRPDRIHLNTAVRPAAEAGTQPVSKEKLDSFRRLFTPPAEVIATFSSETASTGPVCLEKLLNLLRRHPATAAQLAQSFDAKPEEIAPLLTSPHLQTETRGGETYYKCR
jgi:wyosine [tRNA(Phe)-imidazoG37] synthetase (radical SAM superfamily)